MNSFWSLRGLLKTNIPKQAKGLFARSVTKQTNVVDISFELMRFVCK